jgi:serine/threonine protein phosphatase PrpC
MLVKHKMSPSTIFHLGHLHTLKETEKDVEIQQQALLLHVGSQTDPGICRKDRANEDSIFVTQGAMPFTSSPKPFAFLVVADGMGGQGHGQEASQLAIQSLVEYVSDPLYSQQVQQEDMLTLLRAGILHANRAVYERNQEQKTEMGTTMTAALVVDNTCYVAHVGDSRCYLYHRPTGLSQITQDHSVVAALVTAGVIQPDEIYTHPRRNLIYRCIGEKSRLEVDTYTVPLVAGDTLLLCSDGLWEMVRDKQIESILTRPNSAPIDTAQALVQAALDGGGDDNVSVIVAQVSNV